MHGPSRFLPTPRESTSGGGSPGWESKGSLRFCFRLTHPKPEGQTPRHDVLSPRAAAGSIRRGTCFRRKACASSEQPSTPSHWRSDSPSPRSPRRTRTRRRPRIRPLPRRLRPRMHPTRAWRTSSSMGSASGSLTLARVGSSRQARSSGRTRTGPTGSRSTSTTSTTTRAPPRASRTSASTVSRSARSTCPRPSSSGGTRPSSTPGSRRTGSPGPRPRSSPTRATR